MMKIAIIGATGMLGQPVAQQLIEAGYNVTILARNTEKAKQIFSQVPIIQVDVSDVDSLIKGFEGQEAIYLNLSVVQTEKRSDFHTETDGMQNIVAAAKETGINRIAYLSSIVMRYQGMNGFRWWVFDVKRQAVELIKASGIPFTIFYPSTFTDSFHLQMRGNAINTAGKSKQPMWFIAASDYGKQVAKSFAIIKAGESKQYAIQGPEGLNGDEAAAVFVKYYPKAKLKVMNIPLWSVKIIGLFNQRFNYLYHILEAINNYPEKFVAQNTWDELGTPTVTVKEFAEKYA